MRTKSNPKHSSSYALTIVLAMSAAIAGCSSDDSDQSSSSNALGPAYTGEITLTEEYVIPDIESDGNGGYYVHAAKNGNFPAAPTARILHSDALYGLDESLQPEKLLKGDAVSIQWKMYGLRSGELVEDSETLFPESAAVIVLGGGQGGTAEVPAAVHDALLGQRVGDKIQVVFQYDMEGIPEYLESDDAYTLVIEVLSKS